MENVLYFLINSAGLKTHKGILGGRQNVDYFRGVNFHVAVLKHELDIMKMIPTFVEHKIITQLKDINDSIRLGNNMIYTQNCLALKADPKI